MMPFPESFPVPLIYIEETDSTNHYLNDLCNKQDVSELTTVVANYQTLGRGQRGNSWESEKGKNLIFSFVLYPTSLEIRRQFLLSQIISLSIKEELDTYVKDISIKWPNDIYWKERKICGILIENDLMGVHISQSIAGIGININQEEFFSPAPNPVSLKQITGQTYELSGILAGVMQRIIEYYSLLQKGEHTYITHRYQKALFRKKGMHKYSDANGEFIARTIEVEADGHLVLQDDTGKIRRYVFKGVQHIL
ncbi:MULTISPECIES: biotin--[acetyl-CoA-carboxylase] ligase [unclassified Bacteroides]|uniref:biotin--[acetyl-CoA-carboxylase] ligase n=1 Tax=unclassified Bacteroides TaxID=2646097 RepID=UPI0013E9CAC6|nr:MULTISPECIES: biotin--[acetyl-CoA-carboxylase] ligase [unclassified Bacteroides]QTO27220.1 biotin--[acetyl-CoA-carboxylase] ligase [Bacteroides sp. ZJ-18]